MIGAIIGIVLWFAIHKQFVSDDFSDKWYEWLTHQFAHLLALLGLLSLVVSVSHLYWEVPTQWQLATNGAGLAIAFEFMQFLKGGKIFDKIQDAMYMCYGCVPVAYLFKVGADGLPKLQSHFWLTVYISWVAAHSIYGVAVRWRKA
jgi:uncharacterized BrkB/YihY/UPF0761 family membrane protein